MGWYRFEEGNPLGALRLKHLQLCCYDMTRNGDCFDEEFIRPSKDIHKTFHDMGLNLTYVETEEDKDYCDRFRLFVYFDNDDIYELKLEKLTKEQHAQCSNFYGGRKGCEQHESLG